MRVNDTFHTAFLGLRRNGMRSLLTTLGIIIGVGSVTLMVSVGSSFERFILDQVSDFSGDTFEVQPKGLEQVGKATDTITKDDYEAIRKLSTVKSVAPVIFVRGRMQYGREDAAPIVFGTTKELFHNFSLRAERGRLITDADVQGANPVAVIGTETAEELFGDDDPMGKRVTLGTRKLTVVGVLESLGSTLGQQMDRYVYIPYTLAESMTDKKGIVSYISLQAAGNIDLTEEDIVSLLRARHDIRNPEDDPDKDDFIVRSFEQALAVVGTVTLSITLFLGLVAGISLLVGGIGIMNIMLVAVTERTAEIGLRKALGARSRDILLQFLIEAVLLTVAGGIIGLAGGVFTGFTLSLIASRFLADFSYALPLSAVFLSLSMAAGIGLVFGLYPAQQAAGLDPIEAMRYE